MVWIMSSPDKSLLLDHCGSTSHLLQFHVSSGHYYHHRCTPIPFSPVKHDLHTAQTTHPTTASTSSQSTAHSLPSLHCDQAPPPPTLHLTEPPQHLPTPSRTTPIFTFSSSHSPQPAPPPQFRDIDSIHALTQPHRSHSILALSHKKLPPLPS